MLGTLYRERFEKLNYYETVQRLIAQACDNH